MGCKLSLLVAFMVTLNSYAGPTQKTQYRGFTVHKMDYKTLLDARENWGANQVRYMIAPAWHQGDYPTKMAFFEARVKELPLMLDNARRLGLSVIVDLHQIPNDHPRRLSPDKKFSSDIEKRNATSALYWEDQNNLRILKECWAKLAKVTAAFPDVDVWLELLNEPLDWNDFPSYPRKWPSWAEQTIQVIRKIDRIHPVVFASGPGALSWGMRDLKPLKDPCDNVIYTIHMWQPHGYTHQGVVHSNIQPWPGVSPGDSNAYWDKNKIIEDIQGVIDFQNKYGVRIHVGEFGVPRYAPGRVQFLEDTLEIIESHGWDWNYHAFREAGIWSLENGSEILLLKKQDNSQPQQIITTIDSEVLRNKDGYSYAQYGINRGSKPIDESDDRGRLIRKYMQKNTFSGSILPENPLTLARTDDSKKRIYKKLLIVGNSLTHHAPSHGADGLHWDGDWGMAASSQVNDFAHVLKSLIEKDQGTELEMSVSHISDEHALSGYSHLLNTNADLIVFQLGDNFQQQVTDKSFRLPYEKMVSQITRGADQPDVLIVGTWWSKDKMNAMLRKIAEHQNAMYVPIHQYQNHRTMAVSESYADKNWIEGVQWHPGDRGMQKIAKAIFKHIRGN